MKIEQSREHIVINEWQLGQELNKSLHSNARDKFNLLLSLLSQDARDFAQFEVIDNQQNPAKQQVELRKHFQLREAQPLTDQGPSAALLSEYNHDLTQSKLTEIRFKQLLSNEALLSPVPNKHLPDEIIDNLPLIKRQRLTQTYSSNQPQQPLNIAPGIDVELLDAYQKLDLDNKPIQLIS